MFVIIVLVYSVTLYIMPGFFPKFPQERVCMVLFACTSREVPWAFGTLSQPSLSCFWRTEFNGERYAFPNFFFSHPVKRTSRSRILWDATDDLFCLHKKPQTAVYPNLLNSPIKACYSINICDTLIRVSIILENANFKKGKSIWPFHY